MYMHFQPDKEMAPDLHTCPVRWWLEEHKNYSFREVLI